MFGNLTSAALPSLNALRAFEAMARTGRATLAAEELRVTHSAVSRQVKALEAALGVRLFSGPRHQLCLTAAGKTLLADLTPAFDAIAAATLKARAGDELHLAVNASISVKWLIPRLGRLSAALPDLRLHLVELAPHATAHRGAHAVIRLIARERLRELRGSAFMDSAIGPVTAPDAAGDPRRMVRLASITHPHGWSEWAEAAATSLPPAPEQRFAHLHFGIDAAAAGLGAMVAPWPLAADQILAGGLAAPLGFTPSGGVFALLRTPGVTSRALDRFEAWLRAEGEAMAPAPCLGAG